MKIITEREYIRDAPQAFKAKYYSEVNGWSSVYLTPGHLIYDRLCALDLETATPEDLVRASGIHDMGAPVCSVCREAVGAISEYDDRYGNPCFAICRLCLKAAYEAILEATR